MSADPTVCNEPTPGLDAGAIAPAMATAAASLEPRNAPPWRPELAVECLVPHNIPVDIAEAALIVRLLGADLLELRERFS